MTQTKYIVRRIGALAVIVAGLLLAVLSPAVDETGNGRLLGFALLGAGVVWLLLQRGAPASAASQEPHQYATLQWYQSPILWLPIAIVVVGLLTFFFAK